LHYLGTSFGFTQLLLKFWRKNGYEPVYLRQTVNDITSEHSGIMIRPLDNDEKTIHVEHYVADFKRRFTGLLGYEFRKLNVSLALEILHHSKQENISDESEDNLMNKKALEYFVSLSDYNRLKSYTKNQVDYHLILDLIPTLAKLYFTGTLGKFMNLGYINQAILVGIGLQMKSFDDICKEIKDLEVRNALPLFQKTVIKFTKLIQRCFEVTNLLFRKK
jgi:N-acetyltransferase 10